MLELLHRIEGIKVNAAVLPCCCTPLFAAAERDRFECVARLLAEPGIEVNQADKDGCTPLFVACQDDHVHSVKLLLADERGHVNQATRDDATSNIGDRGQWIGGEHPFASVTPLRIAAQKGHLEVVRVLVEQDGIDLDKAGNTQGKIGFLTPLQAARAYAGDNADSIVEVLLAAGAKDDDAAAASAAGVDVDKTIDDDKEAGTDE